MAEQTTLGITSIYDAIDYVYQSAKSERQKGDMFERVCAYYLRSDPQLSQVVSKVWLWDDNPLLDGQDTGIDLVAEDPENEGRYWAIQCKCYDRDKTFPYEACSTRARVRARGSRCLQQASWPTPTPPTTSA